jgi:hypothetical protein
MGASCSPAFFEKFSTFLEWAAKKEACSERITHYADDFFMAGVADESHKSSCVHIIKSFEKVCEKLGVPLAREKSLGPSTKMVYLGLEIDSVSQKKKSIPQGKLASIKDKVERAM